jgi:hypothetical protein
VRGTAALNGRTAVSESLYQLEGRRSRLLESAIRRTQIIIAVGGETASQLAGPAESRAAILPAAPATKGGSLATSSTLAGRNDAAHVARESDGENEEGAIQHESDAQQALHGHEGEGTKA